MKQFGDLPGSILFTAFVTSLLPSLASAEIIHLKAKQGKVDEVIAELDAGVPVDLPATSYVTIKGVSPLFVASQFGQGDVVSELLKRGADPNLSFGSTEGSSVPVGTALHAASGNGRAEIVRILIEAGADLTAHTYATGTPLHLARARGYQDIEQMLMDAGSPLSWNAPDLSGRLNSADIDRGAILARGCEQCHGSPTEDLVPGSNGPNLWGVVGRVAGEASFSEYSKFIQQSGLVWTEDALNSYLASPYRFIPGTTKYPTEITDPQDRADLIAFLRQLAN